MKIRTSIQAALHGTVLLVSLLTAAIIGLTLASYLIMTQNQSVSIFRSQTWNTSMVITEAGIEDGLQMINRFAGSFDSLEKWTNYANADNWTSSGNVYTIHRSLDPNSYDVWITNSSAGPTLTAVATVPWIYQFNTNQYASATPTVFFAAGNVNPAAQIPLARRVYVQTKKDALFNVAMASLGTVDLKGNNIATDSFDSGDPAYRDPTTGQYPYGDLSRTKAGGDICTDSVLADSLNIGNANIKGTVRTGPGQNTITIGANGTVGDRPWVEGGNKGIQPGHSTTDFNVIFPDVVLPSTTWLNANAATPGNDTINGIKYQYIFNSSGDYRINSLNGNIYVGTNASVRIKFTSSVTTSQYIFTIVPDNAYLQAFVDAPTFSLTGSAYVDNRSAHPERFYLYGTPNCTSISYGGNGAFYGCVYAPEANFTLGGGGSDTFDFVGSSVTALVTMNGHYNFHFDENLRRIGPARGYIPTSWKEVAAQ